MVARGQICSQVRMLMKCQHRLFAFSGFCTKQIVRIIYFDRSGACVSEPIQYRTEEGLKQLLQFFGALHLAKPSQRGHDETVEVLKQDDLTRDTDAITLRDWWRANKEWLQDRLKEEYHSLDKPTPGQPEQVKIIRITGTRGVYICSGRPLYRSRNLLGRTTRCFVGIMKPTSQDINKQVAVLVKDHWRIVADDIRAEGMTYDELEKIQEMVPYLAKLAEKGDVQDHKTRKLAGRRQVDTVSESRGSERKIPVLSHYRMVFTTIGRPLKSCKSPRQIVQIILGILKGASIPPPRVLARVN